MAELRYRGNLASSKFPFLAKNQGRTVIIPSGDNTFNRAVTSATNNGDVDRDPGIPQIYYCHNVMPYANGYQSIGFLPQIPKLAGYTFTGPVFRMRDPSANRTFITVTTAGFLLYNLAISQWSLLLPFANPTVTVANVNGQTYIYVANVGCYKYDWLGSTWVTVPLTGLTPTAILGITAANGYLIAYDTNTIYWSSTITPTDFVPSQITGAGSSSLEGAKAAITCAIPCNGGFIAYTAENAVSCLYSGNSSFPFNFREIIGAGGVTSQELVVADASSGEQYAYTTSGLQQLSPINATIVHPDLTDFVAGHLFEDFNDTTLEFEYTTITSAMPKKLALVSSRYLVMSYGVSSLTHALIFDLGQKRWGKIKLPHVACFEFESLQGQIVETPRSSIAFLQADGTVYTVDFSLTSMSSNGTIILGKYQYTRQTGLQMNEFYIENNFALVNQLKVYDLPSVDGKSYRVAPGVLLNSDNGLMNYGFREFGINHSILMQGPFDLASLELRFYLAGNR